jgi:hypothetical protein
MYGQNALECWKAMPDTLLPYLDANNRTELVDRYDISQKADDKGNLNTSVTNRLKGTTRLDTLTENYLRLTLNERATWEMKLLTTDDHDFVIATSMTVTGESADSKVSLFSRDWKHLSDTIFTGPTLLERPDTMTESNFNELLGQISLVLWKAEFSPDNNDLTLSPSLLFIPHGERERFAALFIPRKLRWNGASWNADTSY